MRGWGCGMWRITDGWHGWHGWMDGRCEVPSALVNEFAVAVEGERPLDLAKP